ncbi:MAG: helix-turn-helix transcriptional regulator [Treponema sp.]|nr:helix-turn-helix transcriptional regulator [Treponema sp.]MBR1403131.1 helix-turn-helix transcriptional regulator [Treponema sp.]
MFVGRWVELNLFFASIIELASAVGLSNSTFLSYIDARGVLPNVETAVKIAKYLGVTVEYLVESEKINLPQSQDQKEKAKLMNAYEKLSNHDKSMLVKIANAMSE